MQNQQNIDTERMPVVGITHGDFNGIGYEVIIKALNDKRILEMFTPVIYGLSKVLAFNRKTLGLNEFNFKAINQVSQAFTQNVNIINLSNHEVMIEYGKSTPEAGQFAYKALESAVSDLHDGKIDVVVTAPINKSNIQSDEFEFPGHTEYFATRFNSQSVLMLMVNEKLRVGIVTGHIPLKEVPGRLTSKLITEKLDLLNHSLITDFGIDRPKIAVLGLNPHAGDHGLIGTEDEEIINPAILQAKNQGRLVYGPYPADGFFGSDDYTKFDAILAMYHDQGLIPFKTLAFQGGVNYTAGLPVVRTSPAHGTAYEKAGMNVASETAMRQALYLAVDIFRQRIAHAEMNNNPLPRNHDDSYAPSKESRDSDEMKEVQD